MKRETNVASVCTNSSNRNPVSTPVHTFYFLNEAHLGFCFMDFEKRLKQIIIFLGEKNILNVPKITLCLPQRDDTTPDGISATG